MKILIFFTFLLCMGVALSGCGYGDWKVEELYAQKIEGTSKILYKYDAWGGLDSHAYGYIILDSAEMFKVDVRNDLPFTYLLEISGKTFVKGVSTECNNSCGEGKKGNCNFYTD